MRRRGHLRLILYFTLVAACVGAVALALLGRVPAGGDSVRETRVIVVGSVVAVALLGALGVIAHRLTVAKARWRETQGYLLRIERASDKYRALLEGAADMLLVVDPLSGIVSECNAAARDALGLSLPLPDPGAGGLTAAAPRTSDVRGTELFLEGDRARFADALQTAARAPGTAVSVGGLQLAPRRSSAGSASANGLAIELRPRIADARLAAVDLGTERVVHVALRDVTAQKELERQLAIHERLSSVGLLTAGVAHEINNPLEGIGNYLTLLGRPGVSADERARYLELVQHGFRRIGDIVRELLRFTRPRSESGRAELGGVVDRALKLLRYTEHFRGVEVELTGFERPIEIVGDAGRLEQLVFNLVLNAAQVLSQSGRGGRIWVRARALPGDAASARSVELCVEDSGPGIAPEHIAHLFDPFFTTRGGTGLGLSISYGIARTHGGTLSAENRVEGGARFTLRLPWPEPTAVTQRA